MGLRLSVTTCEVLEIDKRDTKSFKTLEIPKPRLFAFRKPTVYVRMRLSGEKNGVGKTSFLAIVLPNQGGSAILIKKSIQVVNSSTFHKGNVTQMTFRNDQEKVALFNIYAPCKENQHFYSQLFQRVIEIEQATPILVGDFNVTLHGELDAISTQGSDNSSTKVLEFMEQENFVDVWRVRNPEAKQFTWHRGAQMSRLDYLLMPNELQTMIQDIRYKPGFRSDHSIMEVILTQEPRDKIGPGFWKFNNIWLRDEQLCEQITNMISEHEAELSTSATMSWDWLKCKIRKLCIDHEKNRKTQVQKSLKLMEEKLHKMQDKLAEVLDDPDKLYKWADSYDHAQRLIDEVKGEEIERVAWSRTQKWWNKGEQNNKEFYRGFKKPTDKQKRSLIDSTGQTQSGTFEVLAIQNKFFRELYRKKQDVDCQYESGFFTQLDSEDAEMLEAKPTKKEFESNLKKMEKRQGSRCGWFHS